MGLMLKCCRGEKRAATCAKDEILTWLNVSSEESDRARG